jgi:hypothetical protein
MTGFSPALLSLGREIHSPLDKEFIMPKSFNVGKWVESGVSTLIKYVADAAKLKKEQQEEHTQKFNDEKCERFPTFVNPGTKVLIQQERQTNLNKEKHEKLIPLYDGLYEVVWVYSEDATLIIHVGEDKKTVRAERIKLYRERLLRLRLSKEIEYPEVVIEETIDPTDKGYMPDEALTEKVAKEAEKRAEDIADTEKEFRVGDKVGVYFNRNKITDGRNWFCGVILKIERRKERAWIKFLDGSDKDWYPTNEEMRHCPDHRCGAEPCFLITELGVRTGSIVATPKGIGQVFSERENYVTVHIDKKKWPVTFGRDKVSAIIPETPENLWKRIVQLKKRSRKRKIVMPDLSGTF